jgi:hypothetical protein
MLQARAEGLLKSTAAWRGVNGSRTTATSATIANNSNNRNNNSSGNSNNDSSGGGVNDAEANSVDVNHPVSFSYWLARNLPLNDAARQQLLAAPSVAHRLTQALAVLDASANSRLVCSGCGGAVARKASVFCVAGAEGTVGAYVNPHGIVHQTVTLRDVRNVLLDGPVKEQSPRDTWIVCVLVVVFHGGVRVVIGGRAVRNPRPLGSCI